MVGLSPFRWSWPFSSYDNGVQPRKKKGWDFSEPGIAKTTDAPEWLKEAITRSSLQIALEIRPLHPDQFGPARILSISQDPYYRNLTIAQERTDLVVRLRTPETSVNGTPAYHIDDVFGRPGWQQILVLIGPEEVAVEINGAPRFFARLSPHALLSWASNYPLALGNEITFDRPWLGQIRRAEIRVGQMTIDYALAGVLDIPRRYYVFHRNLQIVPFFGVAVDRKRLSDWLINFAGFVPFGWLLTRVFAHDTPIRTAVLASIALSLSIEIGQIFLPERFTSSEDLILNVAGGAVGATLASRIFRVHPRPNRL